MRIRRISTARIAARNCAEIVKALVRGQSENYRMLERLVARQYVMRSPGGDRHALSLKLFALAHRHPPVNHLVTQALPLMDQYARQAEQSCHLGMYDRGNVLIVARGGFRSGRARASA